MVILPKSKNVNNGGMFKTLNEFFVVSGWIGHLVLTLLHSKKSFEYVELFSMIIIICPLLQVTNKLFNTPDNTESVPNQMVNSIFY